MYGDFPHMLCHVLSTFRTLSPKSSRCPNAERDPVLRLAKFRVECLVCRVKVEGCRVEDVGQTLTLHLNSTP